MTIVGVDLSSYRVDTAWMSRNLACRWHVVLGPRNEPVQDRIRNCRMQWPLDVTEVCIEYPYGPNRRSFGVLMAVVGAVTRSVPRQARISWVSTNDLRKAIGANFDTKPSAHAALHKQLPATLFADWDEHELDALVACLGWTKILDEQEQT